MEVHKALVPIFIEIEIPKSTKQIGTGVFIYDQAEPFLYTAAHVTDDLQNGRLLVPTKDGLSQIEGYLGYLDLLPGSSRDNDSIDIAYYRLSTDFATELSTYFHPITENAEIAESSLELNVLSVAGYPASKTKRKGKTFTSELICYRGYAAEKELYDKFDFLADRNIIIRFQKKDAINPENSKSAHPPSPRGLSGGAIFAWPNGKELSQDWHLPTLVGIIHSYKEKEGVFIGTTLLPYVSAKLLGEMKGYDGIV